MDQVLVIGSGGREHVLAWSLCQSSQVGKVYISPGNAGSSQLDKVCTVDLNLDAHEQLADWCVKQGIDMVVVGPEDPLAKGLADSLTQRGITCFGPSSKAARIEASKEFAKLFMDEFSIPTARWKAFTDVSAAIEHINSVPYPALVVKASGLAAGKGVIITNNREAACCAVRAMLEERTFGSAGDVVVIEELLEGPEVSCLTFSDGTNVAMMPPAQDHKRLLDGDRGLNTGGMGAYCPCPLISDRELEYVRTQVIQRAIDGMRSRGHPYVGVLYAGIMLTAYGPRVLEFNCRFGDPETQVIVPLLKTDLYTTMRACVAGSLPSREPSWHTDKYAVAVIMASGGYPGTYQRSLPITGECVDDVVRHPNTYVFHAGTSLVEGQLVTSGGRVLAIVVVNGSLVTAKDMATQGAKTITFTGAHYRSDIADMALRRSLHDETPRASLSYAACGVDVAAGGALVEHIKLLAARTSRPGCVGNLGGFAGVFDACSAGYRHPLLVSGTDGVGTKLKIAQACGRHDTIGIDLVAMCVNDVLASAAEPLFFLDYFACGSLDGAIARDVIAGITDGCCSAECALLGGETAEMPGMYRKGEYDLAGFVVGAVEMKDLLPRSVDIRPADVVIGIASSGLHSNGFSMVRKVVEMSGLGYKDASPFGTGHTLGADLLVPTKIYSKSLLPVLRGAHVKAYAHVTGGGLPENLPRVLPRGLAASLDSNHWEVAPVFAWLQHVGGISESEMLRTFNLGVGAVLVVSPEGTSEVLAAIRQSGEKAWEIGVLAEKHGDTPGVIVSNLGESLERALKCCDVTAATAAANHLTEHESARAPRVALHLRKKVGVLISGTGTNLLALINSCRDTTTSAQIELVISNVADAPGLQHARDAGIPTQVISHKQFKTRAEFDAALDGALCAAGIELVCLAGFMRILTGEFVKKWRGRLINIHPSLLPAFKGLNAHEAVLEAGVRLSGCTVHYVVEEVDTRNYQRTVV
ncbi:PREDICTED: trifunctional purine biosynthetic protein adenosine-3-like [Priapulus caudatus]|uniref:Trifunctional purine biosynthetic protein adenosine-3 n=1 Tax=Priapulus caudatus TaxID=37621 RepID=A0ABM1DXA8_PRICU|nr:PREDICTED: trifunctional purine biosynthetic protein adenosine-3-like [Priapulus caudatus]